MESDGGDFRMELQNIIEEPAGLSIDKVIMETDLGAVNCLYHFVAEPKGGVVWVGGAGGGLYGPAGGLYLRLAKKLAANEIASLRVDYRRPNQLNDCILDTLLGTAFLEDKGCKRIVLVGHSFGGAVVISACAVSEAVVGVAALSSQTYGTDMVEKLSPKALLLIHGTADQVLPDVCSRDIYQRADEPKLVIYYKGCGHGLDECQEKVDHDLLAWIWQVLE